jgi:hypothetical protein
MLRKSVFFLTVLFFVLSGAFGQNTSDETSGREIRNTVGAVKAANPGDYILLKSGRKYVLTKEEIDIVNGVFNYDDLSDVKTEIRDDGTEIKTISEGHIAYIFPDGQSQHILKTGVSFTAYMEFIEENYYIVRYIDVLENLYDYREINSPRFNVFRASVEFQTVSNGIDEVESAYITAYNFKGENFIIRYCSVPDMVWGNISSEGSYRPTGQSRQIEFDIE